jgi:hypothetical protein
MYDNNQYASYSASVSGGIRPVTDANELRRQGIYRVVTPDECIDIARAEDRLIFKPLVGGMDPDIGWEGLKLVADKVLPKLHRDLP